MRDGCGNLAEHRQFVVLQSRLLNLLVFRYVLDAEQKISVQLIAVSNGHQQMLAVLVFKFVVLAAHEKHFPIQP
ncbi:hypothetical protein D3C84_1267880 [compost metagenome]